MKLLDINKIDPVDYSFSVNVAFIFSWVDNRVDIHDMNKEIINVDLEFIKKIMDP